ncbi:MAG: triose-phosphate isomerase [Pseudomonadota bacterium]
MRRKLIAGNWKMNAPRDARTIVDAVAAEILGRDHVGVVICPPYPLIPLLVGRGVRIGAQNCHHEASGAHTGDVSAEMLAAFGVTHVIVGHSERRNDHLETDLMTQAKVRAAHRADITAILCVGESAADREMERAEEIVAAQLRTALAANTTSANTIIAYEPVWAIGTGEAATPDEIADMHAMIRDEIAVALGASVSEKMRILYGGSMNRSNAEEILSIEDVDGGLVGGASLSADDFLAIVDAV